MNKTFFALLIFAYSIYADTLYLKNGGEIINSTIIEVGYSEVKYKIGENEILFTMKISDISAILYSNGTKEIFDPDFNFASSSSSASAWDSVPDSSFNKSGLEQCTQYDNSSVLAIAALLPLIVILRASFDPSSSSYSGQCVPYSTFTGGQRWATWGTNLFLPGVGSRLIMDDKVGLITQWALLGSAFMFASNDSPVAIYLIIVDFLYNIFRSISYNKPRDIVYNKHGSINFAIMPNRHGDFMPAVMFSKVF